MMGRGGVFMAMFVGVGLLAHGCAALPGMMLNDKDVVPQSALLSPKNDPQQVVDAISADSPPSQSADMAASGAINKASSAAEEHAKETKATNDQTQQPDASSDKRDGPDAALDGKDTKQGTESQGQAAEAALPKEPSNGGDNAVAKAPLDGASNGGQAEPASDDQTELAKVAIGDKPSSLTVTAQAEPETAPIVGEDTSKEPATYGLPLPDSVKEHAAGIEAAAVEAGQAEKKIGSEEIVTGAPVVQAKEEANPLDGNDGDAKVVQAAEDSPSRIRKVFWINLDINTERYQHMMDIFGDPEGFASAKGVETVRVPGVDREELAGGMTEFDQDLAPLKCKYDLNDVNDKKSRSCGSDAAHRRAYQKIAEQDGGDDTYYLVAEDDVYFAKDWQDKWLQAVDSAPDDWTMLRIGFWGKKKFDEDRVSGTPWIRVDKRGQNDMYQGAFAIVLTPPKARALVAKLRGNHLMWADSFTGLPGTYLLDQNLLWVKPDMASTIQNPYANE